VNDRYVIRPKADADLDHQALYLAEKAKPEVGRRFLIAAHETFTHCLHRIQKWDGIPD
jgi:plasmid stabilization system protein ParE